MASVLHENVGHDFARLLRQLEDPRISIYLALLKYRSLTREAIMKETGLSRDRIKRALAWLIREVFVSRIYIYKDGARVAAYHVREGTQTVRLSLETV